MTYKVKKRKLKHDFIAMFFGFRYRVDESGKILHEKYEKVRPVLQTIVLQVRISIQCVIVINSYQGHLAPKILELICT